MKTTGQSGDAIAKELTELGNEIRGIADEVRLKIHLAGMEARDAWNRVEPALFEFEQRVERAAHSAVDELRVTAAELKESLRAIRESI